MVIKPLLAATASEEEIQYPCLISPKLDGIRCLGIGGKAMSRKLLEIPNQYVQSVFASGLFDGLDGELIVGSPNAEDVYLRTMSAVMSRDGTPDFTYYVFDTWYRPTIPFAARLEEMHRYTSTLPAHVKVLTHITVHDLAGLLELEDHWLSEGYEGVMGRSPNGIYKMGRSTMKQGILWKLKRFTDEEFEVVGFEELMHNENEATVDELGHTKRSSHKENKVGGGTLGALILKHPEAGEFRCGTGFTAEMRAEIWANRHNYLGRFAKIKYFQVGVKDLPRFPVFLGWRDPRDM